MTKGKIGIALPIIAALVFVFAILNQPLAILLIVGFAVIAEKDEWLNRQVIQGLLLNVAYIIARLAFNIFFGFFDHILTNFEAYEAASTFGDIHNVISDLLYVALLVFAIISIIKVVAGKEANIPVLSKIAEGGFKALEVKKAAPVDRFCANCGTKLEEGSAFCPECGTKVN